MKNSEAARQALWSPELTSPIAPAIQALRGPIAPAISIGELCCVISFTIQCSSQGQEALVLKKENALCCGGSHRAHPVVRSMLAKAPFLSNWWVGLLLLPFHKMCLPMLPPGYRFKMETWLFSHTWCHGDQVHCALSARPVCGLHESIAFAWQSPKKVLSGNGNLATPLKLGELAVEWEEAGL